MLRLLKYAHHLRGQLECRAFDEATAEPEMVQRRLLLQLLHRNAETRFGKMHGFAGINTVADYRKQVQIRDYEQFRPFISRLIDGEQAVLTKEQPFMLTMTSGTTGEPKYIPVTRVSQAAASSLMRQWITRAEDDHAGLTSKATVGIASRAIEGVTASGLPYGSASGLIYKNIPWLIRRAYAVPYLVSEIEEHDEKYFILARFALGSRVSCVATPNPTTLLRIARLCAERHELLVRAIHDGSLGTEIGGPRKLRAELSARLRPDPARAKEIESINITNGHMRLSECWPDLRMVGCWLGGSVGFHAARLTQVLGDVPLRDLGYMASEGSFTLPFSDGTSSGILAVQNNFFEFIPEEDIDSKRPVIVSSHELEIGRRYEILLTTSAGLYRYRINDIVEATGRYRRTPLMSFVRKTGDMTNITGEKIHANHLISAFEAVCRRYELEIEQFRAVPNFEACRYDLFLELKDAFPQNRLRREVLPSIDAELQQVNVEYWQKRSSGRLEMPVIYLMRRGWAREGLRRHIAQGKRDTQYKPQILCPERTKADDRFTASVIHADVRAWALPQRAPV